MTSTRPTENVSTTGDPDVRPTAECSACDASTRMEINDDGLRDPVEDGWRELPVCDEQERGRRAVLGYVFLCPGCVHSLERGQL